MSYMLKRILSRTSTSTTSTLSTSKPRLLRLRNVALFSALSFTSYSVGALYPPSPLTLLQSRSAQPPPPPPDTPAAQSYAAALEESLQSLPLLRSLRAAPDAHEWYEARPYARLSPARTSHSLSAGTLRGPGRLALAPLVRARKDESESIVIVHVGSAVCGHRGFVHGGMLATLTDEVFARTAINNLPAQVGVTANLTIDYRAPTRADQFLVFRTHLVEQKGRKARVEGTVETLEGELLVQASALFVQPRYASALLDRETIRLAMGVPEPISSS